MPKIRSTQRTVQVNTPRLTPPSTAGFGASGRATQQLGNEISKFAGVFDAFAQAEEKNQAANLQSDFYQLQIDSDKQLADFGNEHKGDGNSYFQGAGSIFDNNGQKFVSKYAGNDKLAQRAQTMVQGAKVQYQRKAIAKGQQIQHDRAIIKSTEISASIRGGMLTPENLKEGGLGIVQESTDKYFKIVDGLPMSEKAKTVVKQKFVKDAAKQVEDQADPSALLKWRSEIGKKLKKEGGSEKPVKAGNELKTSKASDRAVKMIYGEEGLRLKAYLDPVGVPTIGYGHTKGVKLGQTITKEQAVQLAQQDIKQFENAVDRNIKVPLSQNQYDALVSFAFNLGEGNLKKISGDINAGNFAKAAKRMLSFNKARDRRTGQMKRLPGLVSRRKREANLFMQKGGGKVAGFQSKEPPSLDMQIAGAINWKNVEKRHEAEQEQAFLSGVVSGEIKVSPYDSETKKKLDNAFAQILTPGVNILKDEKAQEMIRSIAKNKGIFPKQLFEKARGHIESEEPKERSEAFELLSQLEFDNPANFRAGKGSKEIGKKIEQYRFFSKFYGQNAVVEMMKAEERREKMTVDVLKEGKNKFLKSLSVDDFSNDFERTEGIGDWFPGNDPHSGISASQKQRMLSEFKTLALNEYEKTGNEEMAKASAKHLMSRLWGETRATETGIRTIMKYPPENFIDPVDADFLREQVKTVAKEAVDLNRPFLEAAGYEILGGVILRADEKTERFAAMRYAGQTMKENVIVGDGLSKQIDVPLSPYWQMHVLVKRDGAEGYIPLVAPNGKPFYYSIEGLGQEVETRKQAKIDDQRENFEFKKKIDNMPLPKELNGYSGP